MISTFFRCCQASRNLLPRSAVRAQRPTHDRRGDRARQAQAGSSGCRSVWRSARRSVWRSAWRSVWSQQHSRSDKQPEVVSKFVGRKRPPNPSATPSARNLQGIRLGIERVGKPPPRSAAADSEPKRRTSKKSLVTPPSLVISRFVSFKFVLFLCNLICFDFICFFISFHFISIKDVGNLL